MAEDHRFFSGTHGAAMAWLVLCRLVFEDSAGNSCEASWPLPTAFQDLVAQATLKKNRDWLVPVRLIRGVEAKANNKLILVYIYIY